MGFHSIASFCSIATIGLISSACAMLGPYANGALMAPPVGATAAAPVTEGSSPSTSSESSTPASVAKSESAPGPSTVSVTLINGCPKTVKLFFGDKPKFGSGKYDSLGSNTRLNQTFRPGDQLWIVDDGQNGISSVKIEPGMREVQVTSSCDAFRTR
jgi:hypothetical protein